MRNKLFVDGVDLSTYGVYISGGGTFSAPEKEFTWYSVPNKNGDILGYQKRLSNITVSYKCGIYTNFEQNISDLRNFLLSRDGLVRISDTYHAGEFRMGVYAGPFEPTIEQKLDAGQFVLSFNCQPQRWLVSGETPVVWSGSNLPITNPTMFVAKPLLRIYGYGGIAVQSPVGQRDYDVGITITDYGLSYIDIDCETMNCYNGDTNLSAFVTFAYRYYPTITGVDAPVLKPGENTIIGSGNVTSIEITPRWWEV